MVIIYNRITKPSSMASCDIEWAYNTLGVDKESSFDDIQNKYRELAKTYHPDKSKNPNATATFQNISRAYRRLSDDFTNKIDIYQIHTINIKENTSSLTIQLTPKVFLVWLEACSQFYSTEAKQATKPQHGIQLKCSYSSTVDKSTYGTIAFTWYKTTAKLLVQGNSYLLWYTEHFPLLFSLVDKLFNDDPEKWITLSEKQHIGSKRLTSTEPPEETYQTPPNKSPSGRISLDPLRSLANSVQKAGKRLLGNTLDISDNIMEQFPVNDGIPMDLDHSSTQDDTMNTNSTKSSSNQSNVDNPMNVNKKMDKRKAKKEKRIDIRCILCMSWSMVTEKELYGSNMYTCDQCRTLPSKMNDLLDMFTAISDTMHRQSKALENLLELRDENCALRLELDDLRKNHCNTALQHDRRTTTAQTDFNLLRDHHEASIVTGTRSLVSGASSPVTGTNSLVTGTSSLVTGTSSLVTGTSSLVTGTCSQALTATAPIFTPRSSDNQTAASMQQYANVSRVSADTAPSLIIGNSMLRAIKTKSLHQKTRVKTMSGATINDVTQHISTLKTGDFSSINFLIGSKDCALSGACPERIICDFERLLLSAKNICPEINVLSITPRLDSTQCSIMSEKVNTELEKLCSKASCKYMDIAKYFRNLDGSINDQLLHPVDRYHLSFQGTQIILQEISKINPDIIEDTTNGSRNRPYNSNRNEWPQLSNRDASLPNPTIESTGRSVSESTYVKNHPQTLTSNQTNMGSKNIVQPPYNPDQSGLKIQPISVQQNMPHTATTQVIPISYQNAWQPNPTNVPSNPLPTNGYYQHLIHNHWPSEQPPNQPIYYHANQQVPT